jgi:hypothetical protein
MPRSVGSSDSRRVNLAWRLASNDLFLDGRDQDMHGALVDSSEYQPSLRWRFLLHAGCAADLTVNG